MLTARYYELDVPPNPIEKEEALVIVDSREGKVPTVFVGKDVRKAAKEKQMKELESELASIDNSALSKEAFEEMMKAA